MFTNNNIGPYMGVSIDKTRGRYRLCIYSAYNAMGLIGTEYNGIVVLDDQDMQVVADKIDCGMGIVQQHNTLQYLLHCSPEEFCKRINDSSRSRYDIEPSTVPEAEPLFKEI
jgi:hypothetical protein